MVRESWVKWSSGEWVMWFWRIGRYGRRVWLGMRRLLLCCWDEVGVGVRSGGG